MSATALSPLSALTHAAAPDAYSLRQTVSDALSGVVAAQPSCLTAVSTRPARPSLQSLIHLLPKAVKRRYEEDDDDDLGDDDDDLDFDDDDDLDFDDDDDFEDDDDFDDDDLDFEDDDFEDDDDDFEDRLGSGTPWRRAA